MGAVVPPLCNHTVPGNRGRARAFSRQSPLSLWRLSVVRWSSDPHPSPTPALPEVAWLGWTDSGDEDGEPEDDTSIDEED